MAVTTRQNVKTGVCVCVQGSSVS